MWLWRAVWLNSFQVLAGPWSAINELTSTAIMVTTMLRVHATGLI